MSNNSATVISLMSSKGGSAKSTTALNFGAYLTRKRKHVLFIDLDYQNNLTQSLVYNLPDSKAKAVGNSFIYRAFEHQAHHSTKPFPSNFKPVHINKYTDLFASSPQMDDVLDLMRDKMAMAPYVLTAVFAKLNLLAHYDYIIVDCHNSFTLTAQNALVVSDYCISPIVPSLYSINSINTMIRKINNIKEELLNPATQKSMVHAKLLFIGQMIAYNTKNSHQFKKAIRGNKMFVAAIPKRELFNRAATSNIYDLAEYEASHKHNRNDLKIIEDKINPEFDKIYRAIGGTK